jgi:hypothetical protein
MTTLEYLFRQWRTLAMIRTRRLAEVKFLLDSPGSAEDLVRKWRGGRLAVRPNVRWRIPLLVRQIDSLERTIDLVAESVRQEQQQRRVPTQLVLH